MNAKIAILDPTKQNAGSTAGWLSPVGWGLVALLACVARFHGLSGETEWNPRSGSRRFRFEFYIAVSVSCHDGVSWGVV